MAPRSAPAPHVDDDEPLVTAAGALHLHSYKYKGEDHSVYYNTVGSRLAEALVVLLPRWLAPNTITLVGLVMPIVALYVAYVHNPGMTATTSVPAWVSLFAAGSLFFYQTLDNVDGKQARRTGSSSPLGLLFDHGCDAVNAGLVTWGVVALLTGAAAGTWQAHAWWLIATTPFFLNTWEEYHIGKMILPVINGPNEGLLGIMGFLCAAAYMGPAKLWAFDALSGNAHPALRAAAWAFVPAVDVARVIANAPAAAGELLVLQPKGVAADAGVAAFATAYARAWAEGLPWAPPSGGILLSGVIGSARTVTTLDLVTVGTLLGVALTIAYQTVNVVRYLRARGASWLVVLTALARQVPFWGLLSALGMWFRVPATLAVVQSHWPLFYLVAGSYFVEMTVLLMVAHVCGQSYGASLRSLPERLLLFTAVPLFSRAGLPELIGQSHASFVALGLVACVIASLVPSAWAVYSAFSQVARALDVDVFSIRKQTERAARGSGSAPLRRPSKAASVAAAAAAAAAEEEEPEPVAPKAAPTPRSRASSATSRGRSAAAKSPAPPKRAAGGSRSRRG